MFICESCGKIFDTKAGLAMHDTRVHCWNVGLENKRIQASREGITRAFPNGKELTTEHKNKIADSLKGRMPKNIALLHSPEIEKRASAGRPQGINNNLQAFWLTPEGQELHRQTALKMTEKRVETPEKRADWLGKLKAGRITKAISHDKLIVESIGNYEKAGYRCVPIGLSKCPKPDFIAFKEDLVYAVEIEQGIINYKQIDKYANSRSYYNDIHYIWVIDQNGKRGKRPDDKRTVEKLKQIQGTIFKQGGL